MTGLTVVQPLTIIDAMLESTNVAENDYPAWSATTAYGLGARVISAATHKVYQSIAETGGVAVTFTNAVKYSSGVTVNWAAHGKQANDQVTFSNSGGALPTGLVAGTVYYVRNPDTSAFQISATEGGALIAYTDAGTGTHYGVTGLNCDPANDDNLGVYWLEVGPTNRWSVFDCYSDTATAKADSLYYTLRPGRMVDVLFVGALVGASSVRLRASTIYYIDLINPATYDRTIDVSPLPPEPEWYSWFFDQRSVTTQALFDDLPIYLLDWMHLEVFGNADLQAGVVLLGDSSVFGTGIAYGVRASRVDYSRREANEFGDMTLVQRASAKTLQCTARVANTEIDALDACLNAIRSQPALFIAYSGYGLTVVLGIFQRYEILIAYPTHSDVAIDFLELT